VLVVESRVKVLVGQPKTVVTACMEFKRVLCMVVLGGASRG